MYLGIDPSLTSSGVCLIHDDGRFIKSWLIKSKKDIPLPFKLMAIIDALRQIPDYVSTLSIDSQKIKVVGIEMPFFGPNKVTSQRLFSVYGAMLSEMARWNGPGLLEVHPLILKKFVCAKTQVDKETMLKFVRRNWGFEDPSDDVIDAFALAHVARCTNLPTAYTIAQQNVLRDYLRLTYAAAATNDD